MSLQEKIAATKIHQIDGLENGPKWRFRQADRGVEWRNDSGEEPEWKWLCDPIEVAADTRDAGSENWGRLLVFEDRDSVRHEWAAAAADLSRTQSGDVVAHLARLGFVPPVSAAGKARLVEYFVTAKPAARLRAVGRVGWEGSVFVLPDASFGGNPGERIWFQLEGAPVEHSYRTAGDLAEWQARVAAPSTGNTRLVFAICCAFTGPLLYPLGGEGGGFHLRGASSVGKSTALKVASSVWGGGGISGFTRNWRATDNGLEGVAVQHCDTFLALDELGQVDGKVAAASAYMLANGQGKSRAGKSGAARPAASWRVLFLSTGEISLVEKISEDGRGPKAKAGQEIRILDIPANPGAGFGLFDHLPDGMDGAAFSNMLNRATSEVYGTPSRAFVEWLCADTEKAITAARRIQEQMLAELVPPDADGQVKRAAGRFALVAAAGELATHAGVTSWQKGEACRAATACFKAWLEARGDSGPGEIRDGIEQVRLFLERHGASRFQAWNATSMIVSNRAGFIRTDDDDERTFCILPAVWRSEVCQGRDAKTIASALIDRGFLDPGPGGKASRSITVPALGQSTRLYCINSRIFEGENDG
jgi:putative DNA primase/helicase